MLERSIGGHISQIENKPQIQPEVYSRMAEIVPFEESEVETRRLARSFALEYNHWERMLACLENKAYLSQEKERVYFVLQGLGIDTNKGISAILEQMNQIVEEVNPELGDTEALDLSKHWQTVEMLDLPVSLLGKSGRTKNLDGKTMSLLRFTFTEQDTIDRLQGKNGELSAAYRDLLKIKRWAFYGVDTGTPHYVYVPDPDRFADKNVVSLIRNGFTQRPNNEEALAYINSGLRAEEIISNAEVYFTQAHGFAANGRVWKVPLGKSLCGADLTENGLPSRIGIASTRLEMANSHVPQQFLTAFELPVKEVSMDLEADCLLADYSHIIPYGDPSKVVIESGWSLGGYMTMVADQKRLKNAELMGQLSNGNGILNYARTLPVPHSEAGPGTGRSFGVVSPDASNVEFIVDKIKATILKAGNFVSRHNLDDNRVFETVMEQLNSLVAKKLLGKEHKLDPEIVTILVDNLLNNPHAIRRLTRLLRKKTGYTNGDMTLTGNSFYVAINGLHDRITSAEVQSQIHDERVMQAQKNGVIPGIEIMAPVGHLTQYVDIDPEMLIRFAKMGPKEARRTIEALAAGLQDNDYSFTLGEMSIYMATQRAVTMSPDTLQQYIAEEKVSLLATENTKKPRVPDLAREITYPIAVKASGFGTIFSRG